MSLRKSNISGLQQMNSDEAEAENHQVDWEYSEDPYGESAKGILLAQ